VTYSATATDIVDVSVPVTCSSPSGFGFALGTTTVTCSSTDAHGNTATGFFHVNVFDFSMVLNGCPTSINVGQSGTCKLTITAPQGSSSVGLPILTLTVNGCPAATTCSLFPQTVTAP